jgi:hypothetical protein
MSKVARRRSTSGEEAAAVSPLDARMEASVCAHCAHRADDRHVLEQRVAGLVVFGSGFGASVARSRLCTLHDRLVSPHDTCSAFHARER